MARKVNPISVRLHLNRSSDSSRFSDIYYGKPMYQDVNPREYFGSIRPPTRKTFGFRLGRCIPHHSPKRTFIHLFPPRRPQRLSIYRGRRGRSKPSPGKRWWAMGKGPFFQFMEKGAIGRLDRKDSTRSAPSPSYRFRRPISSMLDMDMEMDMALYSITKRGGGSRGRILSNMLSTPLYIRRNGERAQRDIGPPPSIYESITLPSITIRRTSDSRPPPTPHPIVERVSHLEYRAEGLYIYADSPSPRIYRGLRPSPPLYRDYKGGRILDYSPLSEGLYPKALYISTPSDSAPLYIRERGSSIDIGAPPSPPLPISIEGGSLPYIESMVYIERGARLDDRSEVIWRRRSPSSQYPIPLPRLNGLGGSHSLYQLYLRVSGWLAHKPMSVSRNSNDFPSRHLEYRAKCFNFLLPRLIYISPHSRQHSRQNMVSGSPTSRRLLQTIPAVRPSSNYLVMQYSFHMENRIWTIPSDSRGGPLGIKGDSLYLDAPDSSLDKRIRAIYSTVESLTAKTRSAPSPYPGHYPKALSIYCFRSLLFPLLGATLFFLRDKITSPPTQVTSSSSWESVNYNQSIHMGWGGFQQIDAREQLLGKLGRALRNRLGSRLESIDLGGFMRRIGMMIGILPKNRRIPYGYNYYLNEVRKMRSLLSGGTNANTSIGSVKIESVYQSASSIAQDISFQLRDGTRSFRSIFGQIVRDIPLVMPKGVGGIRICCSGRLKGAEIARTECREYGKTSCNAFRHQIDYAYAKVSTRYGILGVKVWIPFP
uniref:Ribosomal protein S3 n=1 Tax=Cephalotaxus sinensis TaxID=89484 RepID=D2DX72_9CONI|nr:ribosomal protein S3 [Cephalotaxus sinensis]